MIMKVGITFEGVCSQYDFAKAIFEINNNSILLIPIEIIKYPMPAVIPYYCVLNKQKIKGKIRFRDPTLERFSENMHKKF